MCWNERKIMYQIFIFRFFRENSSKIDHILRTKMTITWKIKIAKIVKLIFHSFQHIAHLWCKYGHFWGGLHIVMQTSCRAYVCVYMHIIHVYCVCYTHICMFCTHVYVWNGSRWKAPRTLVLRWKAPGLKPNLTFHRGVFVSGLSTCYHVKYVRAHHYLGWMPLVTKKGLPHVAYVGCHSYFIFICVICWNYGHSGDIIVR